MIKNIIFDLGGVLIDYNPQKTVEQFFVNKEDIELLLDKVFFGKHWREMDKGDISYDELLNLCYPELPEHLHKRITHIIKNMWNYMPPFPEMYPLVKRLHDNGYKIYLLSNTSDMVYEYKDLIPALSLFDGIIASSDYHVLKPDKAIYQILFDKFSLKPEECFFIDDTKANTDAAEELGMPSFCHKEKDIELLKEALENANINI